MHRILARAAAFLCFAGALAAVAPAGAQPVVPLEGLAGATIQINIPGQGGTNVARISGELPLTLPYGLDNNFCHAAGTATLAMVDGALQLDVASSIAGEGGGAPCPIVFSGELDDQVRLTVPSVGDRVTPLVGLVERQFPGTDNARLVSWSGKLQGNALSEVLNGLMPDVGIGSGASRTQPLPELRIVQLIPGDRPVYQAGVLVAGQADNGGGALGAAASFEASIRFVVMVPPRPPRPGPGGTRR